LWSPVVRHRTLKESANSSPASVPASRRLLLVPDLTARIEPLPASLRFSDKKANFCVVRANTCSRTRFFQKPVAPAISFGIFRSRFSLREAEKTINRQLFFVWLDNVFVFD